jgi:hypothetical protein
MGTGVKKRERELTTHVMAQENISQYLTTLFQLNSFE